MQLELNRDGSPRVALESRREIYMEHGLGIIDVAVFEEERADRLER